MVVIAVRQEKDAPGGAPAQKTGVEVPRAHAAPGAGTRGGAGREVILGIDPGLLRTGYAILAGGAAAHGRGLIEAGVIRLPARASLEARLVELETSLQRLIEAHRPTRLVCEELYAHYRHPRTAILMAHARGAVLLVAARAGLEVVSVGATFVKKMLTGSGRAGKAQVQRAVALTLGLARVPEPHDVADAVALALCGLAQRLPAGIRPGRRRRAGQP